MSTAFLEAKQTIKRLIANRYRMLIFIDFWQNATPLLANDDKSEKMLKKCFNHPFTEYFSSVWFKEVN
jgi:hypothetical protein